MHAIASSRLHDCVAWTRRVAVRSTDLAPMKDIKEYFTANKQPLISRSVKINQRLRAATGLQKRRIQRPVAVSTVAAKRATRRASAAAAGRWLVTPALETTAQHQRPLGGHTRNLISVRQHYPDNGIVKYCGQRNVLGAFLSPLKFPVKVKLTEYSS